MKLIAGLLIGLVVGALVMYFLKSPSENEVTKSIVSFKFYNKRSGPVTFNQARAMHQKYLKDCLAEQSSDSILRYLTVARTSIDSLFRHIDSAGYLRIYFGDIRALDTTKHFLTPEITTFLVAVNGRSKPMVDRAIANGHAVTDEIIDNLPPCPFDCPGGDPFY